MARVRTRQARAWLPGLCILAAFLAAALTLAISEAHDRRASQRERERTGLQALSSQVSNVLAHQEQLAHVVGAFNAPVAGRWPILAQTVMGDPAAQEVGLIVPVSRSGRNRFQATQHLPILRALGTNRYAAAPSEPFYAVLADIVGRAGSSPARRGMDLWLDPARRSAMSRAATVTSVVATKPVPFLSTPDAADRRGVITFAAVFTRSHALIGWTVAAYDASRLSDTLTSVEPGSRVSISDHGTALLASRLGSGVLSLNMPVAGRVWTVSVWSPRAGVTAVPWLVVALGLLLAGAVTFWLRASDVRERYALRLVDTHLAREREAIAQLRKNEGRLARTQTLARLGSWELDRVSGRLLWSDELCDIAGQAHGFQPTYEEFLALIHPDDRPGVHARVDAAYAGASSTSDYRIIRPDGEVRWLQTTRFYEADADDQAVLRGASLDITERKQVELELAEAREHAETIKAAMAEGYALTEQGRIVSVNPALCEMTGFEPGELIDTIAPYPFWAPELITENVAAVRQVVQAGGGTIEVTFMRKSGERFPVELTARPARRPDSSILGFVTTARDVSQQRRYEAALERERRDLHAAQTVAGIGSWDFDLVTREPGQWSAQLWTLLELAPEDSAPPLARSAEMVHPEDRQRVLEAITASLSAGRPFRDEFRMITATGRELVVAFASDVVRDDRGRPLSAYGTVQDITDIAQRRAEERALRVITKLVAEGAERGEIFDRVAQEVLGLLDGHSAAVVRFDARAGQAEFVSDLRPAGFSSGARLSLTGDSAPAQVFRSGQICRIDTGGWYVPEASVADIHAAGLTGVLAAPIRVSGDLWGAISVTFSGRPVPEDGEHRLDRFASLVAIAIANAEAWDALARQAATDGLTALANHRTFQKRLATEVSRTHRYSRELSLALIDIDHFKGVNDRYGHQVGDRVLAELARRLDEQARTGEMVARIGGEEFAWLMPETDRYSAVQAAERMRKVIEDEPFDTVGHLTVSVGLCVSEPGVTADDLVRFADRALYWAKDSGRNRTFLYTQDAHALLSRGEDRPLDRRQAMSGIRALARAIDSKDPDTREHSERVAALAERIALALGWTTKRARLLHDCGLLHDVGKIGIPDEILLKPGRLTAAEYEQVSATPR